MKFKIMLLLAGMMLTIALTLSTLLILQKRSALLDEVSFDQRIILQVLAGTLHRAYGDQGFSHENDPDFREMRVRWDGIPGALDPALVGAVAAQTDGRASILHLDPQTEVFANIGSSGADDHDSQEPRSPLAVDVQEALGRGVIQDGQIMIDGMPFLTRWIPVADSNGHIVGALEARVPALPVRAAIEWAVVGTVSTTALLLAVALGVTFLLLPLPLRPIDEIRHAIQKISRGDYAIPVPCLDVNDPVGDVARV